MAWTSDRVEALKNMWSEGKSASQIAADLGGVTRNAVIGKIHRLGLSNRGSVSQKEKQSTIVPDQQDSATIKTKNVKEKSNLKNANKINNNEEKKHRDIKFSGKDNNKMLPQEVNKSIIFTANQPLPPQPSTSEISEETLKNVKSLEKKSKKLSLMELTERTCKWPIGDPATEKFWFCGHIAEPGKPYCETHIEIAFQPIASRREKRSR